VKSLKVELFRLVECVGGVMYSVHGIEFLVKVESFHMISEETWLTSITLIRSLDIMSMLK